MKNWGIEPFEPENPIFLASAQILASFAEKAFCFPCSGTSANLITLDKMYYFVDTSEDGVRWGKGFSLVRRDELSTK
jgi:hypothetical protein